jgi:glycosyltransferase involved in cell wall biosynthesis
MNDPKVTVLMSVYNGAQYIAEAMESILSQSFGDFEFLIIDDGSTEPVEEVIRSFKDSRIRFYRRKNVGLTLSLNHGIELARGKYIARADADDVSLPGRLAGQVKLLDSDGHLDLVGSFFQTISAGGDVTARVEVPVDPLYRLWRLQFHNVYAHGSVMFRKSGFLRAGSYDGCFAYAQDYDLWSRLSVASNTQIMPIVYYSYRFRGDGAQTSEKHYRKQIENAVAISNRSLKSCNPDLEVDDCEDVRALYWNFERDGISTLGLENLRRTFHGFCRRFGIHGRPREKLRQRLSEDVSSMALSPSAADWVPNETVAKARELEETI